MPINRRSLLLVAAINVILSTPILANEDDPAAIAVKEYQRVALQWVATFGTTKEKEKVAHERMNQHWLRVIKEGRAAINHLVPLLKHKQVNIRRGSASALSEIVRLNNVKDRKLLDAVLLRMIEDTDIKVRSNLYHVANGLIDELTKLITKPKATASPKKTT